MVGWGGWVGGWVVRRRVSCALACAQRRMSRVLPPCITDSDSVTDSVQGKAFGASYRGLVLCSSVYMDRERILSGREQAAVADDSTLRHAGLVQFCLGEDLGLCTRTGSSLVL